MCLLKSTCTDGLDYVHVDTCRMSKSCCIQVTMTLEKGRILCLKQSIVVHTCTLFFKEIRHTCMKFSVYFGTHIYSKGHVHALAIPLIGKDSDDVIDNITCELTGTESINTQT